MGEPGKVLLSDFVKELAIPTFCLGLVTANAREIGGLLGAGLHAIGAVGLGAGGLVAVGYAAMQVVIKSAMTECADLSARKAMQAPDLTFYNTSSGQLAISGGLMR